MVRALFSVLSVLWVVLSPAVLAREIEVRGKVTCDGKPFKGVALLRVDQEDQPGQKAVTNEEGVYAMKIQCQPGVKTVVIQIDPVGTAGDIRNVYGEGRKAVSVDPNKDLYSTDFILHRGKTITGILRQADGEPVPGAMVSVSSGLVSFATTGKDGAFSVGGACPTKVCYLRIVVLNTGFVMRKPMTFSGEPSDKKELGEIRLPDFASLGTAEVTGRMRPEVPDRTALLLGLWHSTGQWGFTVVVRKGSGVHKRGLIPGRYFLVCPGFSFDKIELVRIGRECGVELPDSLVVEIKKGENRLDVDRDEVKKAWAEYEERVREAQAKAKKQEEKPEAAE